MAQRTDLPIEVSTNLDASGNYVSAWIDSGRVNTLATVYSVGGSTAPSISIDHSSDGTSVLFSSTITAASETTSVIPAARYFRLSVLSGTPGATFSASVRTFG